MVVGALLTGTKDIGDPLQVVSVWLPISGLGFTVMLAVALPVQLPAPAGAVAIAV